MFNFPYIWIFKDLSGCGITAPPRASQFLETAKGPAGNMTLTCNSSREPYPLYLAQIPQETIFLCLTHPRARYQIILLAQSPLKLVKLANPTLLFLPCLAFPEETPIKIMASMFPSPVICQVTSLRSFPCGPTYAMPPASRTCACNERFSSVSPLSPLVTPPTWPTHKKLQNKCWWSLWVNFPRWLDHWRFCSCLCHSGCHFSVCWLASQTFQHIPSDTCAHSWDHTLNARDPFISTHLFSLSHSLSPSLNLIPCLLKPRKYWRSPEKPKAY